MRSEQSRRAWLEAGLGLATLALAGCGRGRDQVAADLDIPAAYRATSETATAAWPAGDWWTGFGSPELNALIARARARNFDIQAAIARVRQADAQVRITGAALLPTLNGDASASWQHLKIANAGFELAAGWRRERQCEC